MGFNAGATLYTPMVRIIKNPHVKGTPVSICLKTGIDIFSV
jgi:hypothetical protein